MASSSSSSKGTRKTYSFEEREILVNLIAKYLNNKENEEVDKSTEIMSATFTPTTAAAATTGGSSAPKRKSVWSQLTEEYNALVGPENTRSTIQLRRCWENMKANKRNRDDKREYRISDNKSVQDMTLQLPLPSALGLPPNVVFQPKESEPFAFEGLMLPTFRVHDAKREYDFHEDNEDRQGNDNESLLMDELPCDSSSLTEPVSKKQKRKASSPKKLVKPKLPKLSKVQKNNDLFEYSISEAQLKLETAAFLKEEAKLKLEEAEYKKEEARMRMICVTYKLQKLREECENVEPEGNRR